MRPNGFKRIAEMLAFFDEKNVLKQNICKHNSQKFENVKVTKAYLKIAKLTHNIQKLSYCRGGLISKMRYKRKTTYSVKG